MASSDSETSARERSTYRVVAVATEAGSNRGVITTLEINLDHRPTPHYVSHLPGCVAVPFGGRIYLIGGSNSSNLPSDLVIRVSWRTGRVCHVARMTAGRVSFCAAATEQRILVFGGCANFPQAMRSCECYDPEENKWEALPDMPVARYDGAAVRVPRVGVFVIGGCDGDNWIPTVNRLCPSSNSEDPQDECISTWSWSEAEPLLFPCELPLAAYLKEHIYVLDGAWKANTLQSSSVSPQGGLQWTKLDFQRPAGDRALATSLVFYGENMLMSLSDGRVYEIDYTLSHLTENNKIAEIKDVVREALKDMRIVVVNTDD